VHKTANILNKMPKSLHTKAKRALQEIWMAETADSGGSRPRIRSDLARHSDLISLDVPR